MTDDLSAGDAFDLARSARVALVLADYAAVDTSGKANIVGGGWHVTTLLPHGHVPPQAVIALVDTPPETAGQEYMLTLTLRDADGHPVTVPTADGTRSPVSSTSRCAPGSLQVPGVGPGLSWCHASAVMHLPAGLPLPPGQYTWTAEFAGAEDRSWAVSFVVLPPNKLAEFTQTSGVDG